MINFREEEKGLSGVLKFDLKTGKLIKKYVLSAGAKPHWLGDLVVNSRGDVYATDSLSPALYRLRQGREEFDTLIEGGPFASPQGLDFSPDERKLFIADYSRGIFVYDMESGKSTQLSPPKGATLLGIDGLYFYNNTLVCVQNGTRPQRVIRIFLSGDNARVERLEVVEANNPLFDEPTLGVLVKDSFYYIANSQWGALDEKGVLAPQDKLREPVVLKTKLTASQKTKP
jgi:sugar lactone lactonase YvrE